MQSQPKRALVTGATSGIGRATAELLASRQIEVGVLAESPAAVDSTVQALRDAGGKAFPVYADLSRHEDIAGLIDRIESDRGPIDLLVNNAGIGLQAEILEVRNEDLRLLFDINYFAMVNLSRDVLHHMAARRYGYIINVSSTAARRGLPGMGIYASTKAAMHTFTQALRVEGKSSGVHVVEVLPMSVRTPFFKNAVNRSPQAYESGSFLITPELVANRIFKAIRRPVPEIYTSTLSRIVLALDAVNPKWFDAILLARRRKAASKEAL
jgi:short-subunit dehydrogenase